MTDEQTDEQTNNAVSRVAFAAEKSSLIYTEAYVCSVLFSHCSEMDLEILIPSKQHQK